MKQDAEYPEILTEKQTFGFWHMEDILAPYGLLTWESYPTFSNSGLSQGPHKTNKHNHFKELGVDSPETLVTEYKTYDCCCCVEVLRPSQQLRSCRSGQLPINTVPGQA